MRECHSRGPLSPSCRPPFRVENIPQEGICKGNICNHDSKAKWYLKMGQKKYQEKRQNTVAPRIEEWTWQRSAGWLCTFHWAGSFTTSKEVPETQREQHLSREGSRPPASAWLSCVPRNKPSSCWQHLWVLLVHSNIQLRDFLIQPWREREGFPHDPDSLAMPNGF